MGEKEVKRRSPAFRVGGYLVSGLIFVAFFALVTRLLGDRIEPVHLIVLGVFWTVFMGAFSEYRYRRLLNRS